LVRAGSTPKRIVIASVTSAMLGLQMGAFSVVIETMLSGRSELPFSTFAMVMQPIHLVIGMVEGFVTAGVINFVRAARPEILKSVSSTRPLSAEVSIRKVLVGLLVAAMLIGGTLSWFASTNPDGLEWSIEKVFGRPELPEQKGVIAQSLKKIQETTAFLPDYHIKTEENKAGGQGSGIGSGKDKKILPSAEAGRSVSGLLGSAMVITLILFIGIGIRVLRKNKTVQKMTNNDIR
jgi:cobalt/nickel transport system permease protein